MNQKQVDEWVTDNNEYCCYPLLDEKLPKMRAKLDRLDKRIISVLKEVQKEFPDACYYTGSGGFNLILGDTHDDTANGDPKKQRQAWGGSASIGDGDW